MSAGARITDAVCHFRSRGNHRNAVKLVRTRTPERLRWRSAVGALTGDAGKLQGGARMRIEEPIREMVLDLDDPLLRREVILDARLNRVDLDRGEVLPTWSLGDLHRLCYLAQTDIRHLARYVDLPERYEAAVDTSAVVLVGRSFASMYRHRAQRLWLRIPDADGPEPMRLHHRYMADRARQDADQGKRWTALSKTLVTAAQSVEPGSPSVTPTAEPSSPAQAAS